MSALVAIPRPLAGEHSVEAGRYIDPLVGHDALAGLAAQGADVDRLLRALPAVRGRHRYAPGKWSVQEGVGHWTDTERIYAYRALRFARDDATPLPGFDEDRYVPAGRFDARTMGDLLDEWHAVRAATLALLRGLDEAALLRRGVANGHAVSVRALAWLAVGHVDHHLRVLRERYGLR
jgi:hypothetical protein